MAFKRVSSKKTSAKKEYDNTNRGALWITDNEECLTPDPDAQHGPELRGMVNINGTDCWLSAFITLKDEEARTAVVELLSELHEYLEAEREAAGKSKAIPLLRVSVKEIEPREDTKTPAKKSSGVKAKSSGVKASQAEPAEMAYEEIPF